MQNRQQRATRIPRGIERNQPPRLRLDLSDDRREVANRRRFRNRHYRPIPVATNATVRFGGGGVGGAHEAGGAARHFPIHGKMAAAPLVALAILAPLLVGAATGPIRAPQPSSLVNMLSLIGLPR